MLLACVCGLGWRDMDGKTPIAPGATEGAAGWSRMAMWKSQSL